MELAVFDWAKYQAAYQDVPDYAAHVRTLLDAEEDAAVRAGRVRPSAVIGRLLKGETQ